jgi:hypothetical protein
MGSESKTAVYEEMQKRIIELESVRIFLRISLGKCYCWLFDCLFITVSSFQGVIL